MSQEKYQHLKVPVHSEELIREEGALSDRGNRLNEWRKTGNNSKSNCRFFYKNTQSKTTTTELS